MAKAEQFPFEEALDEFVASPAYRQLGLGQLQKTELVREFERPVSKQRVYRLIGEKGSQTFYVKFFRNKHDRPAAEFETQLREVYNTNLFWYNHFRRVDGFSTFRPVYFSERLLASFTEAATGENLATLVERHARKWSDAAWATKLEGHMEKTGDLLRVFQNFYDPEEVKRTDGVINRFSGEAGDFVEDIDIRLRFLVDEPASGFSAADRQAVLAYLENIIPQISTNELKLCYVHGDYTMRNIMANARELILHDFGRIIIGAPLFDLTRFYHQLELLKYKPIFANERISALQQAFLRGYGYQMHPEDLTFKVFLMRHYFSHYKGLVRRRWQPLQSMLYSKWVIRQHHKSIRALIAG